MNVAMVKGEVLMAIYGNIRNKYTKEFEDFIKENAGKHTKEELRLLLQDKFNINITKDALRRYINRHNINKCIDYIQNNKRKVLSYPIGAEKTTKDGVFVKVEQPDKWRRKSRIMYEKYHNCKLTDDEYIVFLNRNIYDFSKDNLIKSSRKEIAYLHNKKMFSKNPKLTKLGITTAKLMIKVKEKEQQL